MEPKGYYLYSKGEITMSKKEKVLGFVKTNWKPILAATGVVIGGVVVYVLTKKTLSNTTTINLNEMLKPDPEIAAAEAKRISELNWGVGNMTALWNEGEEYVEAIVSDIPFADCGKLGEELGKIKDIDLNDTLSLVIDMKRNKT